MFRYFKVATGGKVPIVKDWENAAVATPVRSQAFNWGIACGPSNLYVVDCDCDKETGTPDGWLNFIELWAARETTLFPETYTVRTPSGGTHYYFNRQGADLHNTASKLAPKVDTRGVGGYVVASGSQVDGKVYRKLGVTDDVLPLPAWLRDLVRPAEVPLRRAGTRRIENFDQTYIGQALRGEIDRVLTAQPGTRNHTLNEAAFRLGTLAEVLSEEHAIGLLEQAATDVGLHHSEARPTIISGWRSGMKHPREIPRKERACSSRSR